VRLILRFSFQMILVDRPDSKLCACSTRLAKSRAYVPSIVAQLAKGVSPRLNPPSCRLTLHMEPISGSMSPEVRL
jgi:hypothetical protein